MTGPDSPPKLGQMGTRSVVERPDPGTKLNQLDPPGTAPTSLDSRKSQEVEGKSTDGLKKRKKKRSIVLLMNSRLTSKKPLNRLRN